MYPLKFRGGGKRAICSVSSFSLLVYILHENLMIRLYVRPLYFDFVFGQWGIKFALGWSFILGIVTFVACIFVSFIYHKYMSRFCYSIALRASYPIFAVAKYIYRKLDQVG